MRAVMSSAILGVLVTAMVAGGLPAGCSSGGIGQKSVDAHASVAEAPAGGGGVAVSGSDAAAVGSGGSTDGAVAGSGGATVTAWSTPTGGASGVGGTARTGGIMGAGGVTSSGASSASGGSGGEGGTSGTGGPDASADKPRPTVGTPCSSQDDCGSYVGDLLACQAPGEPLGCGACLRGAGNCSTDADCVHDGGFTTGTMICDLAPSAECYCPGAKICTVGCRTSVDCGSGQACNQSHRCQSTCVAGDGTCPVDYSCDESGFCRRNSCASDSECSGFCVKGACYDTRGTCEGVRA
jgi:hypothetical protein